MEKLKTLLLAALPMGLSAYWGQLAPPLLMLVAASVLDYATGIVAAPFRGEERSSREGLSGILRKLCLWMLVCAGMLVDGVLWYLDEGAGLSLPVLFPVACLVCLWLLFNELVSIVENLGDAGVSVPFLLPLVRWVKKTAEKGLGNLPGSEEKEDDTDDE